MSLPVTGLSAACGGPVLESRGADDDLPTVGVVRELLDRRAAAQLAGDERAYLADLDGQNRARESMVFDNLAQLPVEHLQYIVVGQPVPLDGNRPGDPPTTQVRVTVVKVVRLAADAGPAGVLGPGETHTMVLTRSGDRWALTTVTPLSEADLAVQDRERSRPVEGELPPASSPWNLHPLRVQQAGNVWLCADDTVADLDVYAADAAGHAHDIESVWDGPRFPGHVMFLSRDSSRIAQWYDVGEERLDMVAGLALPRPGVRSNGTLYTGQHSSARTMINLSVAELTHGGGTSSTIRHELVHAVTARGFGTGDQLVIPPRWAVEGAARWLEIRGDTSAEQYQHQLAQAAFDGVLPATDTFWDGDLDAVRANYALGYTVFAYVDAQWSRSAAVELYARTVAYHDGPGFSDTPTPFVDGPAFDGICRSLFELSATEFLARWTTYVHTGA